MDTEWFRLLEARIAKSSPSTKKSTDEQLSFKLQKEELEKASLLRADRELAMGLAAEYGTIERPLAKAEEQDNTTVQGQAFPRKLTEMKTDVASKSPIPESMTPDRELLSRLQSLRDSHSKQNDRREKTKLPLRIRHAHPERFCQTVIPPEYLSGPRKRPCTACMEETGTITLLRLPCDHDFCPSCLENIFRASMTDKSMFPPSCCNRPIPINKAWIHLKDDFVQEFKRKTNESQEMTEKIYCRSTGCLALISKSDISGDVAKCPRCRTLTCTFCKGESHDGVCPKDKGSQELLDVARQRGWQRCYKCRHMVERSYGCNHIRSVWYPFPCADDLWTRS